LLPIGNGHAPGITTGRGAIVPTAGLRRVDDRFAAGLRRATVFFFFAAFFFPARLFAFAIRPSSRLPARRRLKT
jgi:hypothetical protein